MDNENSSERGFGEVAEREIPQDDQLDETQDEQVDDDSAENQDDQSNEADDQQNDDQNEGDQEENSQEPKRTEKGTKLDKNPLSAAHQQLANERRIRGQMEQVLADPRKIAQFVKMQYGITMPTNKNEVPANNGNQDQNGQQNTAIATKKWTAKDFESLEDVADKFNQLQDTFTQTMSAKDKEIEDLKKQVGGIKSTGRLQQIADTTASDISSLRALPELNPKNPAFIEGLEDEIGRLYHRLDFDIETGEYRGEYSIREIGESMIATARKARKAGVQQGQTIVKDKSGGRVRTNTAVDRQAGDEDNLPPGQSIAQGIAQMFK